MYINERDFNGFTALTRSIQNGHADIANLLLELGANPNASNLDGTLPIHFASQSGNTRIIRILQEHGADIMASYSFTFDSQHYQFTPLHMAITSFNIEAIEVLIEGGVDVHAHMKHSDEFLFIPYLFLAAWLGFTDAIDLILVSQKNELNQAYDMNRFQGCTILMAICENGHMDAAYYILDEIMADNDDRIRLINQRNGNWHDWTALHYACWECHTDMIELLIQCEADLNACDAYGRTPLHYACMVMFIGQIDILRI